MRRDLPSSLEDLDPDLRTAAERAARRAGMGLDEWIATTLKERAARSGDTRSVIDRRPEEPSSATAFAPDRTSTAISQALGASDRRPDEPHRSPFSGARPSGSASVAEATQEGGDRFPAPPDGRVDALLRSLEERVTEMHGRLAAPGGRAGADTVGSAVAEIRSRQTELDDGEPVRRAPAPSAAALARSHNDALLSLKGDIARLFGLLEAARPAADGTGPAIAALRDELERMRSALGGLATRGEIGALEQALRDLGEHATAARDPGEVEAVSGHLGVLQDEVRRLSETVTADVHKRLARDLDALARKVDGVAESGVDPRVVDALVTQLDELRSLVGELADPRRVEHLADQVASLGRDVADLGQRQVDAGEFAALRSAVEDIRLTMKHPRAARTDPDTARQLEAILAKLEAIEDNKPAVDLSVAGRQIESAAGRLHDLSQRLPREGVDAIARQVETLARRLDDRTGVETLARHVESIAKRVEARDDVGSVAGHLEAIYERLDDRGGLDAMGRQMAALAQKLDSRERVGPDLAERIEELSGKLDRLAQDHEAALARSAERVFAAGAPFAEASTAFEGLTERLDRIDERLREAGGREDRLEPIEAMLGQLADRLGPGDGAEALDALQRQVGELARRMEEPGDGDPALASLQRAMADLLQQVDALREGTLEAAERAAKVAVADTLGHLPLPGIPEIGLLRHDLDDLKSHASAADRRVQDALGAVHRTLEAVASRLASLDRTPEVDGGARSVEEPRPARPARAVDGLDVPETIRVSRTAGRDAPAPAGDAEASAPAVGGEEDVLLEPGAERPRRAPSPPDGSAMADPVVKEIKERLIAAARRSYQEAAAEVAAASGPRGETSRKGVLSTAAAGPARVAARLRSAVERHRRPLILGLAAVVLAIGALQVGPRLLRPAPVPTASAPTGPGPDLPVSDAPAGRMAGDVPARPPLPEPRTTQSIAARTSAEPRLASADGERKVEALPEKAAPPPAAAGDEASAAVRPAAARPAPVTQAATAPVPERIAGIAAIPIPPTLTPVALRQAAIAGDPAAVFEVGMRAAEGRGIARDPALAAKLFERAAVHGNASAQYRIGNQLEKGVGVPRDLSQAKTWYGRAAEGGNVRAMHNLAVLLAEGAGEKPDYAAAARWFRRAAEHGVRDSQFNLGVLLARGLGTEQDLSRSYLWFALAASGGDADAGRKRDEIGERLGAAELAEARKAVEAWRAEQPPPAANDPPRPAQEWTDAAPPTRKNAGARA